MSLCFTSGLLTASLGATVTKAAMKNHYILEEGELADSVPISGLRCHGDMPKERCLCRPLDLDIELRNRPVAFLVVTN